MAAINIPSGIVWVFNPNYIEVSGYPEHRAFKVCVGSNTIIANIYGGRANIYISRLLQLAFGNDPTNYLGSVGRGVIVDISVISISGQVMASGACCAVWGTMEKGDPFPTFAEYKNDKGEETVYRTVHHFVHFPFSLDVLVLAGGKVTTYENGVETGSEDILQSRMATYTSIPHVAFKVRHEKPASDGTFDKTFDYTFHTPADKTFVTVTKPRKEQEGFYLRWVDKFGFIEYFLFERGERNLTTTASEYKVEASLADELESHFYYNNLDRALSVETVHSLKMCACNLDAETLNYVQSIVSSPVVDMFAGYSKQGKALWRPVIVEDGSYVSFTKHKPLQDFEITVKLPRRETQKL